MSIQIRHQLHTPHRERAESDEPVAPQQFLADEGSPEADKELDDGG